MNWEYLNRHCSVDLNELGGQGWELCAIENKYWYIFKRPMKCKNCKHYQKSFTVCYGQGFTLTNENCIKDPNNIKCVKVNDSGCKHFKSKEQ